MGIKLAQNFNMKNNYNFYSILSPFIKNVNCLKSKSFDKIYNRLLTKTYNASKARF